MSFALPASLRTAEELRDEFDRAFAHVPPPEAAQPLHLLAIRVAQRHYALDLNEVLGIHADRKLVAVPSPHPALRGLVGLRGAAVPVYDLALALGDAAEASPRFVAHVRAPLPFALCFSHWERHVRARQGDLVEARTKPSGGFVRARVDTEQGPLPLLSLAAIFQSLTGRDPMPHRPQEP